MASARSIIGLSFLVVLSGCSATCLRDSDCIGASVCLHDRCVLLTSRDGGGTAAVVSRTPTPTPTPRPTPSPTPTAPRGDAGSGDFGSAATATRGFLDAAADAGSSEPGP